jgi:ubiquinone biosynthesis protein
MNGLSRPSTEQPLDVLVPAQSARRDALRNAVGSGVARWRAANGSLRAVHSTTESDHARPGTLTTLPRRKFLNARFGDTAPPQMRVLDFRISHLRVLGRCWVWSNVLLSTAAGVMWDQLRGANTMARRAVRIRRAFERMGGTFVTIGQRLGMRLDLLPAAYGEELSRMLDRMPPFPIEQAVAIVERTIKRPLQEIFAQFDPDPIVSMSTACTYQAILRTGEKVAVKVRRPGVGELFLADLKVFDLIAGLMEFLTIFRPGYTRNIRRELRETVLEELDFVREARHQDAFRRAARKSGKRFFTAPRVHFELSGAEVIVQEFVSGMWLWELLAAVEQKNAPVLALAAQLNIDAETVARRLLWVGFWGWHENLFFLAEPHPNNIIVGASGKLTFIDFSSTGAMDRTKRRALQQNMYYALKRDPLNMARASLALLEPLPPVDLIELTRELESVNWQMIYAFESKATHRHWSERTSLQQWSGLIQVARRYHIVIDFRVLRLLRAAVAQETMALRLAGTIDVIKEYRRFTRDRAARASNRAARSAVRRAGGTLDKTAYLRLERLTSTAEGLLFRLRHVLALPNVNFNSMMSKWSFTAVTAMKFATQLIVVTALGAALVVGGHFLGTREQVPYMAAMRQILSTGIYQAAVILLLFINGRALLFRLDDKDV